MLKHLSLGVVVSLASLGFACGSSDKDDDAEFSTAGTAGSGGTVNINITGGTGGGDGGTVPGGGARDGGVVVLTEEEVETINNSSCAGWTSEPESLPALLQLVVDISLSMNESPDGMGGPGGPGGGPGGGESKWDITQAALIDAIAELPDTMPVGLFFYPNMANEASDDPRPLSECVNTDEGIEIDYLTDAHRERLNDALNGTEPNGWTPTHGAYRHALETFLLPADLPGQKFMLLITDGAPTLTLECVSAEGGGFGAGGPTPVDSEPIVEEVAAAREAGVRTFLIGSPGSEPGRQWMSLAAIQGATAAAGCRVSGEPYCHMDMTTAPDFSAALRAGLAEITGAIVSCTYDLPEPPPGETIDPDLINLIVRTGGGEIQLVRPDDSGDCSEGWQYINDQVVLCAETCSRVQNDPAGRLELLFGCGTEIIPQ
jgi:hypothetical protein